MLSYFINFIFNSFVVSYWMYFGVIERKKIIKKNVCEVDKHAKISDISSATTLVAPDLLNALAILSDTTVRRSLVDWEDMHHTGNQKKHHISPGDPGYLQFSQRLY